MPWSQKLLSQTPIFFSPLLSLNSYHAHTIQVDTARVEKQTFVCTEKKSDAVPSPKPGVVSKLGNWKSPKEMDTELNEKFKGCMKGMDCGVDRGVDIPESQSPSSMMTT